MARAALPRPSVVFFDAGDTLLAPHPSWHARIAAVCAEHGEPVEVAAVEAVLASALRRVRWPADWGDRDAQRAFWRSFYAGVLEELVRGDGIAAAEVVEALYRDLSDPRSYRLFPEAREALAELAGRGIGLGVISNFEPWLREVLRLEGVEDLFSVVAISGELRVAKPDARIFQAALARAGVPASAAVHVGDSVEADVAGARAVGITPVLIDRYGRAPQVDAHRVRTLTELVELLE